MWRKIFIAASVFSFGLLILFISVFRTASVKYDFQGARLPQGSSTVLGDAQPKIDYELPYPGGVLPDNVLWPLKVIRDRVWLSVTTNPTRKAELKLLFADKRIGMAKILFENGKADDGFSTLTKAEKYLEEASLQGEENKKEGVESTEFLTHLANASLKHYEVTETILTMAPEEARPGIVQVQEYPKHAFELARNSLQEKGKIPPENPFNW
ncbi:hypothetical protein A2714_04380 [Candidatus Woesebacteria bacterium RIFCSPHIGHO2_01_FULL_38_9]|uniref:DUF5667 domain-containing protein n=2 Tax=Candidatus Woeseibacteriota TaxID=1752722 RepID=A0A1F7Y3B5_9BACT|nr:MAG: hypothetical protein A2714_04380 [Candidatus Woesebacteria bacterium RIFCSPHIGHO2_01_FULL_38_9]OGM58193.1 MAG: hypothetical protein A3A75_03840 [Candidatus Woesebacteria bacterium RIFCSPLOWO2_01_FULL_39_10]